MEIIEKIKSGIDLTFEEATVMFNEMLSGSVDESLIGEILIALAEKGESEEEIAGSAQAMIGHAVSNVIPVVASNRIGDENGQKFYGSSFIADHRGDFRRLRHVGGVVEAFHPEILLDAGALLLDRVLVAEAVDHDVGALSGIGPRDGEADAAGRAGDEGGLAFQ